MVVASYDFVNGVATGLGWDICEGEDESTWITRELEQFTGLLDKNAIEIYEGDIVRAWIDLGPGGESLETYEVIIGAHGTSLQPWTFDTNNMGKFLPEVIGNIHENAELLK